MIQVQKQPTAAEFIDFYISGGSTHPVYEWLRSQTHFLSAQRRLKNNRDASHFAMRVSGCLGRYYSGRMITDASPKKRAAAAAVYERALTLCRRGFGPYADDDRAKLEELLATARDYMLDKHVSRGFRMKAGAHRSASFLIRELVVFLDIIEFQPRSLNSVISDLVSIVAEVDIRSIERHVQASQKYIKATDQ